MPRHSAAAGLRHDKLSIRAELFMANLFDYNRRQQKSKSKPAINENCPMLLPEVVVTATRSGDELDNIVKEKSRPKADNTGVALERKLAGKQKTIVANNDHYLKQYVEGLDGIFQGKSTSKIPHGAMSPGKSYDPTIFGGTTAESQEIIEAPLAPGGTGPLQFDSRKIIPMLDGLGNGIAGAIGTIEKATNKGPYRLPGEKGEVEVENEKPNANNWKSVTGKDTLFIEKWDFSNSKNLPIHYFGDSIKGGVIKIDTLILDEND